MKYSGRSPAHTFLAMSAVWALLGWAFVLGFLTGRNPEYAKSRMRAVPFSLWLRWKMRRAARRSYRGFRNLSGHACVLRGDGRPLDPCHHLKHHSPDGFEWGSAAGGAKQLALAILVDFLEEETLALALYDEFYRQIIGKLPGIEWSLSGKEIQDALVRVELSE